MYETMVYWETGGDDAAVTGTSRRSGVRPRRSRSDITTGGAELAGRAIAEGLVDECHLFLGPVLVGSGKRALPAGVHAELELLDERRFRGGVVYLHHGK
jgi:dihydrofolate reductase